MSAETSADVGIIPTSQPRVNTAPVSIHDCVTEIQSLWNRHQEMDVSFSFKIGDTYNRMAADPESRRAAIEKRFGLGLYKRFRGFGWVASRWKSYERNVKAPWSWFRDNKPGGEPVEPRVHRSTLYFLGCEVEIDRDGWHVQILSSGDQKGETRVPPAILDIIHPTWRDSIK